MIKIDGRNAREFRCSKCRTLLAREHILAGWQEIKCYNCNETNVIDFKTTKAEIIKVFGIGLSDLKGGEEVNVGGQR
jgi:LSD1 subclass zinc finger protein